MPFGPQYSTVLGNTSMSMNGLQYCPAPHLPSSPYAWRSRIVVWPASTPTPYISNSNCVLSSPLSVGNQDFTPKRVWRALKNVLPDLPNSSLNDSSLVGRCASNHSGSIALLL